MAKRFSPYATPELFFIRLVGTRGCLLLILGAVWLILGTDFMLNPMERFSKPGPGGLLDFLDKGPGVYIFSTMWVIGGAVAIYTAFRRPKTCEDDLGYTAIALPPLLWGFGYWWSWALHLVTNGEFGRERTYVAGLLYFTIVIMIMFLSRHLQDHPEGPCARRRSIASDT